MAVLLPFIALQKSDDGTLRKIGFALEAASEISEDNVEQLEDIAKILDPSNGNFETRLAEAEEYGAHHGFNFGHEEGYSEGYRRGYEAAQKEAADR